MLTVQRAVYYCEFCKRHWLTKSSIEKHEPRCIYNPNRSVCGWHNDRKPFSHAGTVAAGLKDNLDVEWLRIGADGCPACMLAIVVQADLTMEERWEDLGFDYKAEVERFRKEERHADAF
jgi:hypothetical protein